MAPLFRFQKNKNDVKAIASASASKDIEHDVDVVIIGAGWAGLGAARRLESKKIPNFVVLEGRHDIGGRCRTVPMEDGVSVAELGAQWIHGAQAKSNPLYQIALESGVAMARSGYDSTVVYKEEEDGQVQDVTHMYEEMRKELMEDGFFPYQAKRQDKDDDDITLRQCADDYLRKINATPEQRTWLNYILDSDITQEYSGSVEDTSMHWWDSDLDPKGGDVHVAQDMQGGYMSIMRHYAQPVQDRIQLNSKVTCIDWSSTNQVVVRYTLGGNSNDVHELRAKHVLITVPLGVLKAKTISFVPELPIAKQRVISRMKMGLLNKCLFLWDDQYADNLPWPKDKEWIEKISDKNQGLWTEFYNVQAANGRPMLCAFTAGRVAERIEELSEEEIQSQALQSLRNFFAPAVIPEPKQVIITKWGQDEWTRGSYSYNAFGSKHKDRKLLAEPVNQQLYFAGEACHSDFFGTTNGALFSGQISANRIVKDLGTNKSSSRSTLKLAKTEVGGQEGWARPAVPMAAS
jgi:monoamine oxidase